MSQPPAKRRRTNVSAGQKHAICKHKQDFPNASIQSIIAWAKETLQLDIGRSTVSDILKAKEKWLQADDSSVQVRVQSSQHPKLEEALFLWFADVRAKGATVNDAMLLEKAKTLGDRLQVPANFSYSRGWLYKFKTRRGISYQTTHGEAASADQAVIHTNP